MKVLTGSMTAAAVVCLAMPALGSDDTYRDSGNAAYLAATSQPRAGQVRVINARPLTTARVNTQSTRAIDARRAAHSGYVVRTARTPRAYVVTNPMVKREGATASTTASVAASSTISARAAGPDEVVVYEQDRPYPDTYSYDVGNVRAQPSVARAHDGIARVDQRVVAAPAPRVRYVTRDTGPTLFVPGSDARPNYRPVTVRVVDPYARYHHYPRYHYPRYHYGYHRGYGHGCGSYSYYRHRRHYHSGVRVGYKYYGDNYSFGIKIGY